MCLHCPTDLQNHHIPAFYADFDVYLPHGVKAISLEELRERDSRKFVEIAARVEEYIEQANNKTKHDLRRGLAGKVKLFDAWVRSAWTQRFACVPENELTALDRLSSTIEVGRHLLSLVEDSTVDLRMPQYLFQISRFRACLLREQEEMFPQRIHPKKDDTTVVGAKRCLEGQEDGGKPKKGCFVTPGFTPGFTPEL